MRLAIGSNKSIIGKKVVKPYKSIEVEVMKISKVQSEHRHTYFLFLYSIFTMQLCTYTLII